MSVHICWPWREECGRVLRLQIRVWRRVLQVAFHPNATFGRQGRYVQWGRMDG